MDAAIAVERSSAHPNESDIFTDASPLWRQPGAPGGFGGALVARCLMAAAATVRSGVVPYSIQSIFVSGAHPDALVTYHVDRTRDGKGFLFRRVRAEQEGRCVVEALISFTQHATRPRSSSRDDSRPPQLSHQPLPPQNPTADQIPHLLHAQQGQNGLDQPFTFLDLPSTPSPHLSTRTMHRWIRSKGLSPNTTTNPTAHCAALLLMSDHRFVGISVRAHRIPRFSAPGYASKILRSTRPVNIEHEEAELRSYLATIADVERQQLSLQQTEEERDDERMKGTRTLVNAASVSLSHTVYFHAVPRADEWLFVEMSSPWTGAGRALVESRIWERDGDGDGWRLVASCVQEGMVKVQVDARL